MPSDERTQQALAAMAAMREAFRSAVAQAVDEVRSLLWKRLDPSRLFSQIDQSVSSGVS